MKDKKLELLDRGCLEIWTKNKYVPSIHRDIILRTFERLEKETKNLAMQIIEKNKEIEKLIMQNLSSN